jgi:phosphate transport system permease protein
MRQRRATRADFLSTVLALLAALVSVFLAHGLFKLENDLVLLLIAYATFVGTLIATQIAEQRAQLETDARRAAAAAAPPISAFVPSDDEDDIVVDLTTDDTAPIDVSELELERSRRQAGEIDLQTDPETDKPRRLKVITREDIGNVFFALLGAVAFAGVVRTIWGLHGPTGTSLIGYLAFLVIFFVLVRDSVDPEAATDRVITVVVWSVGVLVASILAWMLIFLITKGLPALTTAFFTEDLSKVGPLTPGGGAKHAIIGTFEQVGIAILVVIPLAILTAVYLHEMKGRLSKPVRFITDALSGLPSIVAGLLVFTVWVSGRGFSGFAGSIALIVLMLPTVTRTSEEILRTIPDHLREASLALGAPQWRVVWKIVLPTAQAGLVTAAILGIARGIGETAPMLLTAFGSDSVNTNPFNGPQSDLPLFVWKLIRLPNETQNERGWTGLLVLVMFVLILFITARFISSRSERKLRRSR